MEPHKEVQPDLEAASSPDLGQPLSNDDITIPPIPDSLAGEETGIADASRQDSSRVPRKPNLVANMAWGFLTIAALAIGGWWVLGNHADETGHPDWPHVAAATEASRDADHLVRVDATGAEQVVDALVVTARDADIHATLAVQGALQQNNPDAIRDQILAAQKFPDAVASQVALAPEAVAAVDDQTQFYQVQVFDCCDEDGDIVEILVNGQPFITVPIMHEPVTISIPLKRGTNSIALRGVKDGYGGITVSFITSEGRYFSRRMWVGEEQQLGVIVQ